MNSYLVYAKRPRAEGENPGDEFTVLKFKDPAKTYSKHQIDALIAKRHDDVFEGSVNFRLVKAADDTGAVKAALDEKLCYEEPGIVLMSDDPELDAFMAEHEIGQQPRKPGPRP